VNKDNAILCLDTLALLGIAGYCLFSSIFVSDFAEVNIALPFLDFPIFISEQLLFILVILFAGKLLITKETKPWILGCSIYVVWILIVSFIGYAQWGALTFRNAALFYYALCSFLAYSFYNPRIFSNQIIPKTILFLLLSMATLKLINAYYWYSYVVLMSIIILKRFYAYRWWLIPLVFIMAHSEILFSGSRAHMVGIVGALIFLTVVFVTSFIRIRPIFKLVTFIILSVALLLSFHRFGDQNAIKSILDWKQIKELYITNKLYVDEHKESYRKKPLPWKVYHKNEVVCLNQEKIYNVRLKQKQEQVLKIPVKENIQSKQTIPNVIHNNDDSKKLLEKAPVNQEQVDESRVSSKERPASRGRDLGVAYSNALFRLFIWHDMWEEVYPHKLLTGVGFGQPQRSPSIEILNWASGEWSRDGWIMPHNSFFHMVYRAGLIGLLIIGSLLWTFRYLTRIFIQRKDISGILLMSILVYWCLMAMFSVTLELPYFAVLFWSLLGLTMAYAKKEL
jgi:hypothetical protein